MIKINFVNVPKPWCWGYMQKFGKIFLITCFAMNGKAEQHVYEVKRYPSNWDLEQRAYYIPSVSPIICEVSSSKLCHSLLMEEFVMKCWYTHRLYQEGDKLYIGEIVYERDDTVKCYGREIKIKEEE